MRVIKDLHEKGTYKGVCSGMISFKNSSSSTSRTTLAVYVPEANNRILELEIVLKDENGMWGFVPMWE